MIITTILKKITGFLFRYQRPIGSFLLLATGLVMDYLVHPGWFTGSVRFLWYTLAYLPVALPVLKQALILLGEKQIFTEFFLMGIATLGAFAIGEYPEAVAVMLFYTVGEALQMNAVRRARDNITALLDVRPESARVRRNPETEFITVHPEEVQPGEIIRVLPGERFPLDGELLDDRVSIDTSALTGEGRPRTFRKGDKVLSGMINLSRVADLQVTHIWKESAISRILDLVQHATQRKARTELFIRTFARIYTPVVVALAALLVTLPALWVTPYVFGDWLYRGLVFLVISCPCALVISIPLGYFGGIGAASRHGILVKGANLLDALRSVDTVVFDKTGTLTEGAFQVRSIEYTGTLPDDDSSGHKPVAEVKKTDHTGNLIQYNTQHITQHHTQHNIPLLSLLLAVERDSGHPAAKAVTAWIDEQVPGLQPQEVKHQTELPGMGIKAQVDGKTVLAGNRRLMELESIPLNDRMEENSVATVVHVAVDGRHVARLTIADELRNDAREAVQQLRKMGIRRLIMLSGDREEAVRQTASELGIERVHAALMPEQKSELLEKILSESGGTTAYAGDGINDAPVLARSDIGIAMGALGSDVAVETADVVIQDDRPSKIPAAIRIGKATRTIVIQNIVLALGVKLAVLGLGALGMATLWEAVFADVGVALLAILNAIRIQKRRF